MTIGAQWLLGSRNPHWRQQRRRHRATPHLTIRRWRLTAEPTTADLAVVRLATALGCLSTAACLARASCAPSPAARGGWPRAGAWWLGTCICPGRGATGMCRTQCRAVTAAAGASHSRSGRARSRSTPWQGVAPPAQVGCRAAMSRCARGTCTVTTTAVGDRTPVPRQVPCQRVRCVPQLCFCVRGFGRGLAPAAGGCCQCRQLRRLESRVLTGQHAHRRCDGRAASRRNAPWRRAVRQPLAEACSQVLPPQMPLLSDPLPTGGGGRRCQITGNGRIKCDFDALGPLTFDLVRLTTFI